MLFVRLRVPKTVESSLQNTLQRSQVFNLCALFCHHRWRLPTATRRYPTQGYRGSLWRVMIKIMSDLVNGAFRNRNDSFTQHRAHAVPQCGAHISACPSLSRRSIPQAQVNELVWDPSLVGCYSQSNATLQIRQSPAVSRPHHSEALLCVVEGNTPWRPMIVSDRRRHR